jgi:predicted ATP-grasp superfamily ATP-dependent carboligase
VPYVVASIPRSSMVGVSRFVRPFLVGPGPDPGSDPDAYTAFVLEAVEAHDVGLVLPITDRTMFACTQRRQELEAHVRVAAAPAGAVETVLDKRLNLETAQRLGIPCPAQFELERIEQLPELVEELGFPLGLKDPGPSRGQLSPFRFRWLVARDEDELRAHIAQHCPPGVFPLFQRMVTGDVRNVCCFACDGQVVAAHEYRSVRRLRGMATFREITPLSPDLKSYAEAMLGELRWDGAAHVGFFVRKSDGDARYMETNGRVWASLQGSVAAGWDFPHWTYRYFMHAERPEPPRSVAVGRRSRWAYGDLEALVDVLAGDERAAGGRSRLRSIADYLAAYSPAVDSDVFRLDDPAPQVVEHWLAGKAAARRLLRPVKRRAVGWATRHGLLPSEP